RVDRLGEVLFLLRVQRRAADQDLAPGVLLQHLGDERPGELALVLAGHRRHPGRGVQASLLGQPVAYVAAQALDQSMIHRVITRPTGVSPWIRPAPDGPRKSRPGRCPLRPPGRAGGPRTGWPLTGGPRTGGPRPGPGCRGW